MVWLLTALALSAASAWLVVWLRNRPPSLYGGIDEFSQGLDALAPREAPKPPIRSAHPPRRGMRRLVER
jgi:hypothetical protein